MNFNYLAEQQYTSFEDKRKERENYFSKNCSRGRKFLSKSSVRKVKKNQKSPILKAPLALQASWPSSPPAHTKLGSSW
jgi:hypothetical protein